MEELLLDISTGTVFVDYYASWCAPCMRFMKIVDRLQLPNHVKILKVDIDKVPEVKHVYNITKIPTFIIFKDGQEKFRHEGTMMTLAEITQKVEQIHNT